MKYFVFDRDRRGSCYHEFYKGKWDRKTFWKADSLCLGDDILSDNIGFAEAIMEVIPGYDPYGITEISAKQWEDIGRVIAEKNDSCIALYNVSKMSPASIGGGFHFLNRCGIQSPTD